MHSSTTLVAVVDDDQSMREALRGLLQSVGLAAEIFSSAEDFLRSASRDRTRCLIADVYMPAMTGLELQRLLRGAERRIPIILISAHDDPPLRAQALAGGAVRFLKKPFAAEDLLGAVQAALGGRADGCAAMH